MLSESATGFDVISSEDRKQAMKGAIHILIRVFPVLYEDKDLLVRAMWREQSLFGSPQINGLLLSEAISLLLFKPGFTIIELEEDTQIDFYGKSLELTSPSFQASTTTFYGSRGYQLLNLGTTTKPSLTQIG